MKKASGPYAGTEALMLFMGRVGRRAVRDGGIGAWDGCVMDLGGGALGCGGWSLGWWYGC